VGSQSTPPVTSQSMVSTRSIATSPFNSTGLYYSGFDGNFTAVHNTYLSIACHFADGSSDCNVEFNSSTGWRNWREV
jgi:hypothetical protein